MSIIDFIETVGKLKQTKRMGWIAKGVSDPESVAEHSYRIAIMAAVLGKDLGVDTEKAVKMALVHDLAEITTGDFIKKPDEAEQEMSNAKQAEQELIAMHNIVSNLPAAQAKALIDLWTEYQNGRTPESIAVKELGKLEMALQALEYEHDGNHRKSLDEFFIYADTHIKTPYLKALLEEIKKRRLKNG